MSKKLTLDLIEKAIQGKASCLSKEYLDNKQKLIFKCKSCACVFEQSASKILRSKKNPCCSLNKKKTLTDIKIFEIKKNIEFMDKEFVNVNFNHSWRCKACGEIFKNKYVYLKENKNVCPICYPIKNRSYEEVKQIVEKKGYFLKSIGDKRRLTLFCQKCSENFEINLSNLMMRGQGCPNCCGRKRYSTENLKKEANEKGCTLLSNTYLGFNNFHSFKCLKCSYEWDQTYNSFHRDFRGCSKCKGYRSKGEMELKEELENLTGFTWKRNRSILSGKEIDNYLKGSRYAFEYSGIYYHSEIFKKDKKYHYNKMITCLENNINLITIFEDEWIHKKDKVIGRIKSILSLCKVKEVGRKLELKKILSSESDIFYEKYHLQGKPRNTIVSFGLFKKEELLAVMSLGRHPRENKTEQICLTRLCYKEDVFIIGGAEKLFKSCKVWALEKNYKKIISWSDNRWSSGNVYFRLNFRLDKDIPPDYSYVDFKNVKRNSKSSLRKNKEERLLKETEHELRLKQKKFRIYDCGKKRWVFDLI